jgi:hypothetical protein
MRSAGAIQPFPECHPVSLDSLRDHSNAEGTDTTTTTDIVRIVGAEKLMAAKMHTGWCGSPRGDGPTHVAPYS